MSYYRILAERQLKMAEGTETHVYNDSNGYATIGVGRNIDPRNGRGLRQKEIDFMLANDLDEYEEELTNLYSGWLGFTDQRKSTLLGMRHQLGLRGLMNFKLMNAAIEREDWVEAGKQALDCAAARDPLLHPRFLRCSVELTNG